MSQMTEITTNFCKETMLTLEQLVNLEVYPPNVNEALTMVMPENSVILHAPSDFIDSTFLVFFIVDLEHGYLVKYDVTDTVLDSMDCKHLETEEIVEVLLEVEELMTIRDVETYVDELIYRDLGSPHLNELIYFLQVMKGHAK